MSRRRGRTGVVGSVLACLALLLQPLPGAAATPTTLVGASSSDWAWFDQAVGPVQIYRVFDGGFHFATWQATNAYRQHPQATAFDYSIRVLPQRLTTPSDPVNAQIRSFLATTPKNLIITNWHEPDETYTYDRQFTPAQYRAGLLALARMVRAQNAADGGTRRVSVILMDITFSGTWDTQVSDWWPTDARDGAHVDLIEGDMYEWPHNTNTACCPAGYTDGVNWRKAATLLSPLSTWAAAHSTPWAVAELGVLEDIHDPARRASELSAAVSFAKAHGADHISYFDNAGPRANWRLRYSTPVGTTSMTSRAALMWRSLASGG